VSYRTRLTSEQRTQRALARLQQLARKELEQTRASYNLALVRQQLARIRVLGWMVNQTKGGKAVKHSRH
jgi:hypothetical protein